MNMQDRFKNPVFIMALVAFLYQVLRNFNIDIDEDLLYQGVDLLSYILIGTGIYKSFGMQDNKGNSNSDDKEN